ncbi:hypothetical protein KC343_g1000 [Hortaea werneckii]|uniref:Uncharacterized protein n=1 Tax=Hortaea werneckii TaxID=91943 RepID=A0A3M7E0M7_HORWE|nr:hypothetical protein KC352_g5218 [Hortaea werneckii]KAI7571722.1 hypothetical protein KC317_g1388 [Hortaea werneckii]KAI7610527.1 hypothetical protein KC346_g8696 [Hortaea werneckii]KAI7636899.1 hypothetical protein KC343_g1000 [Hortaea werneckii]KAI7660802.1 hypothetical protein KC319_g8579 [Hortaea werneckii]
MTDNSTQLCGGEAPANTSDSTQPAVPTPPKRVNFPLPRELRDQIYGYLLHHEYTERSTYPETDTRDARLPSCYKFHTNILAVNTQIGEEATEVLRSNDFVQVTTNWYLDEGLRPLEVPIVCDLAHRNGHFGHLRIDYKLHIESSEVPHAQERKFVVVRSGLTKLCRFLQFYLLQYPSDVPVVLYRTQSKEDRRRQIKLAPDEFLRSTFNSSIVVHDRVGKPLSEPAKRQLLEPFQNLIIGGQSIEITTMLPEHELAKFELFMAPPVMNSLPITWRLFELAREIKAAADQRVLSGCITEARQLYRHIVFSIYDSPLRTGREMTVPDMLCEFVLIDTYLCLAMIDLTTSWPGIAGSWLVLADEIFMRGSDQFQASFPGRGESIEVVPGCERVMVFRWLAMLRAVAERRHSGLQAMKQGLEQKRDFRAIMALHNKEMVADYFDHDVNYLSSLIPEDENITAIPIVDKSKLSLFRFPPLVFDFPLPEGWSKPAGWFGFLDKEMYQEMLSKELVSAP